MLAGIKVLELEGLAPVPHCGLLLADLGAQVTDDNQYPEQRLIRGKARESIDLKTKEGVLKLREMCRTSDVLLDPYRPGILEKMGLDPISLLSEVNKGLVICRLTGYGQTGDMSKEAGHDINYVSITGGNGCVIDSSMVEGLAYLGSFVSQYQDLSMLWTDPYAMFSGITYETSDGKYVAVGALEPKFNGNLLQVLNCGLTQADIYSNPKKVVEELEKLFKTKTRDEWAEIFKDKDACVTPVLDIHEAGTFPHNSQRSTFSKDGKKWIPNSAPKFYSLEDLKKSKL
ncbi:hypothetical protein WR25_26747 [Diploscapter pachys]|uniref:Alpha-methylacyl-CoA racemase n=1 Tax=Diploscapter pachys TaxID=2018661 RepID=A0A2A2JN35_9BILA|nr:hypothetical protein WR25_26747 [Diploscapter pachys]